MNLLARPFRALHTWMGQALHTLQQRLQHWLSVPVPQRAPALVPIPIQTQRHTRRTIKLRHLR